MTSLPVMVRFARVCALLLCWAPFVVASQAGAAQPAPSSGGGSESDDLDTIRQMLDQQSKQIDVLAQEIAHLNLLLEGKNAGTASDAETETPATEPEATPPKALPVAPAGAQTAAESASTPPTGPVHVVVKGETLTAIARRYKVTIPELMKVNKITDARKLQIGQTLALPPGAKIPESPTPSPQP
jgi:LysM repeat protein